MSLYAENILGGNRSSHSGPPMPTPEQVGLGMSFHGNLVACAIERATNRDGAWFSMATLGVSSPCAVVIAEGERLGLWLSVSGKNYYRHTRLTWPWVNTVLAKYNEALHAQKVS